MPVKWTQIFIFDVSVAWQCGRKFTEHVVLKMLSYTISLAKAPPIERDERKLQTKPDNKKKQKRMNPELSV